MRLVTLQEVVGGGQPLFVEFVNTLHWYEGLPIELIGTAAELTTWAAEQHLPTDGLTDTSVPLLHAVRVQVRALTEALAQRQALPAEALTALNAALAAAPGSLAVEVPSLTPTGSTQPTVAFATAVSGDVLLCWQVAVSLAWFLQSGPRHRLKLCANPGCGYAFVDTSINGTRRWCFMRYCGNRLKARAFRQRRTVSPDRARRHAKSP